MLQNKHNNNSYINNHSIMALYLSNVKDELNSVIKKLRNLDHHYTETAFAITALEKVSNCSNWKRTNDYDDPYEWESGGYFENSYSMSVYERDGHIDGIDIWVTEDNFSAVVSLNYNDNHELALFTTCDNFRSQGKVYVRL